ncbi:MAG: hypothetical protein GMKNLPBB_02114 [Myxococcota bacterium]|nr:hypothetical protein [Myxococcota bacterium]
MNPYRFLVCSCLILAACDSAPNKGEPGGGATGPARPSVLGAPSPAELKVANPPRVSKLSTAMDGHHGTVTTLQILKDGRMLSGSSDGSLRLWSATGALLNLARETMGHFHSAEVQPVSATSVLTIEGPELARVREFPSLKPVREIKFPGKLVTGARYSRNGRLMVIAQENGVVEIRRADDASVVYSVKTAPQVIHAIAISAGEDICAVGGQDRATTISLTEGKMIQNMVAQPGNITGLRFSPDGKRLIATLDSGAVITWSTATGEAAGGAGVDTGAEGGAVFTPDGKKIIAAGRGGRLLFLESGTDLARMPQPEKSGHDHDGHGGHGHEKEDAAGLLESVRKSLPQPQDLLGSTSTKLLRPLSSVRIQIATPHKVVRALAISPDGRRVAAGGLNRGVTVYDVQSREKVLEIPGREHGVTTLAWFEKDRFATGGRDGSVLLWTRGVIGHTGRYGLHRESVSAIAAASGTLWTAAGDGNLRRFDPVQRAVDTLWSNAPGVEIWALDPHSGHAAALQYDNSVSVWSREKNAVVSQLAGPGGVIQALAFAPGLRLTAMRADGFVSFWSLDGKAAFRTERMGVQGGSQLVYLEGDRLLGGDGRGRVTLMRMSPFLKEKTFFDQDIPVTAAAAGMNGRLILAGYANGCLRGWEAVSGAVVISICPAEDWINAIAYDPLGETFAVGSDDGTVAILDARP